MRLQHAHIFELFLTSEIFFSIMRIIKSTLIFALETKIHFSNVTLMETLKQLARVHMKISQKVKQNIRVIFLSFSQMSQNKRTEQKNCKKSRWLSSQI